MQIVIDIPDEIYKDIESRDWKNTIWARDSLMRYIHEGVVLPEHHGRLIDADRLKEYINECEFCSNCPKKKFRCEFSCTLPDYLTDDIERVLDAQSTILEATEEVQE